MALVLPILSTQSSLAPLNQDIQRETALAVLNLLSINPEAFKDVLGNMEAGERGTLEVVLRTALEGKQEAGSGDSVKPSISLKYEFALSE
jgi:hypothetical protein